MCWMVAEDAQLIHSYSCGRLLSVLQKDPAVLNTLQRHMEICNNVGFMDIYVLLYMYYLEADGWALKRFEVKSRVYAGLLE